MTSALAIRQPHAPANGRGRVLQRNAISKTVAQTLPEYLEKSEVDRLLECAPDPASRLLMLLQWRAGLRVSEALALTPADLHLDHQPPTLRVRMGKGRKTRIIPVQPELHNALIAVLSFTRVDRDRPLVQMSRVTAWRKVKQAADRAGLNADRIGTHTLRHSYARHNLQYGVQLNTLSMWLGHASIKTTLRYLQLAPDPTGIVASIP